VLHRRAQREVKAIKRLCRNSNLGTGARGSGGHVLDSKDAALKGGPTKPRAVAFSYRL
jgi:hypothetical protein